MSEYSIIKRAFNCIQDKRMPFFVLNIFNKIQKKILTPYYRWRRRIWTARYTNTPGLQELKTICRKAFATGSKISMDGIVYGVAGWDRSIIVDETPTYYNFLAGFVRYFGLKTIVEVGTWYGGSALAMRQGLTGQDGVIVTLDIEMHNEKALKQFSDIQRIIGDAATDEVVARLQQIIQGYEGIDLLYLDGAHSYESNKCILEKYGKIFKPKWIILDDIKLQWSMEKLWTRILMKYGAYAYDVGTDMGFRTGALGHGFGVVDNRSGIVDEI